MQGAEGCKAYPQHLGSQKKPEAPAEMHCLRALERVQILGQAFADDSGATGSVSQTEMILDLKKEERKKTVSHLYSELIFAPTIVMVEQFRDIE